MIQTEKQIKKFLLEFIDFAHDEDLLVFFNRYYHSPIREEEFENLSDKDKEFLRDELRQTILRSFNREMVQAMEMFQILKCCVLKETLFDRTIKFRFENLTDDAMEMYLQSINFIKDEDI